MGFLSDAAEVFRRGLAAQLQRTPRRSGVKQRNGSGRRPIPMEIGSYEVSDVLGSEGDLVLLKAWDQGATRWVKLTALPLDNGLDPTERLERMARLHRLADPLTSVPHKNVLRVYGLEYHQGWGCVVAEYLEGVWLSELLAGGGTLPPSQVAPLGAALASVIAAASDRGIGPIALDPADIMLTKGGEIRLCSVAQCDRAEDQRGPSSEAQVTGLCMLGTLLYRCLTGRCPSMQGSAGGLARRAVTPISAFRPSVPTDLERIIMGLMIFDNEEVRLSAPVVAGGLERVIKQHGWTWEAPEPGSDKPSSSAPTADDTSVVSA